MNKIKIYSDVITTKRPLLKKILNQYGNKSVLHFTNDFLDRGKTHQKIYNPQFGNLIEKTFPDLDKNYLEKLKQSLLVNPVISTADHQSPINHPVYLNSNIQLSLFAKSFSLNKKPYLIPPILSFSTLPLNNAAYLRGLLLTTKQGEKRFAFFGSSIRHQILQSFRSIPFKKPAFDIINKLNRNKFSQDELYFIEDILKRFAKETRVNSAADYIEQISIWNQWLWHQLFPSYRIEFLPIDFISKKFFIEDLIHHPDLPVYQIIFKLKPNQLIELFDGIYGCWTYDKSSGFNRSGTFFFWGINYKYRMVPLTCKNGLLISTDPTFKPIAWKPDKLAQAWQENKIAPSLLLNYFVIACHFGLYCSGAFNQIGYFHPMINQYQKALKMIGQDAEAERVSQMKTDGIHAFLYFIFGSYQKRAFPLSGLNIFQIKDKTKGIEKILKQITVSQSFDITAPLILSYIANPEESKKISFSFDKSYKEIYSHVPKELIFMKW